MTTTPMPTNQTCAETMSAVQSKAPSPTARSNNKSYQKISSSHAESPVQSKSTEDDGMTTETTPSVRHVTPPQLDMAISSQLSEHYQGMHQHLSIKNV